MGHIYYVNYARKLARRLVKSGAAEYCINIGKPFIEYACKLKTVKEGEYVVVNLNHHLESTIGEKKYYASEIATEPVTAGVLVRLIHNLWSVIGRPKAITAISDDVVDVKEVNGDECNVEKVGEWISRNMDVFEVRPSKLTGVDDVAYVPRSPSEGYIITTFGEVIEAYADDLIKIEGLVKVLRRNCNNVSFKL